MRGECADGYTMPPASALPRGVRKRVEGFSTTVKKLLASSEATFLSLWCDGGRGGVDGRCGLVHIDRVGSRRGAPKFCRGVCEEHQAKTVSLRRSCWWRHDLF
jgi:hypothetical protein